MKVFVSVRREQYSDVDFKKLILMVDGEITISQLKRQVEREYSDLFPFDEPFICSKIEDNYGYALSNTSLVNELLTNNDRVVAVPVSRQHDGRRRR